MRWKILSKIDLMSKVSTKFDQDEERTRTQDLETDNAEHLLQQEKAIQQGAYEEQSPIGRSLLSPENSLQKQEKQATKVISPFSEEFEEMARKKAEQYEEEAEASESISSNRIQFYMIFAFVFYIIALCIGYHYTSFVDDTPQIVSMKQIDADEYLGKADGYIVAIQQLHENVVSDVESFTQDTMGASELISNIEKNNKKIAEMQEEIKDIVPPEAYEAFQSQLIEMYSLQANMNLAATNYAKNKNESTFKVLNAVNEKYEDTLNSFLDDYNAKFIR